MSRGPLDSPAPEMIRLMEALEIDWAHYNAWVDSNANFVSMLGAVVPEDDHPTPHVRAEYVFQHWNAR